MTSLLSSLTLPPPLPSSGSFFHQGGSSSQGMAALVTHETMKHTNNIGLQRYSVTNYPHGTQMVNMFIALIIQTLINIGWDPYGNAVGYRVPEKSKGMLCQAGCLPTWLCSFAAWVSFSQDWQSTAMGEIGVHWGKLSSQASTHPLEQPLSL